MPQAPGSYSNDHRHNLLVFDYDGSDIAPDTLEQIQYHERCADTLREKAGMKARAFVPVHHTTSHLYKPPHRIQWEEKDFGGFPRRHTFRVHSTKQLNELELKAELSGNPTALAWVEKLGFPYRMIRLLHQGPLPVPYLAGYGVERPEIQSFLNS